jgi:hypothetical protein
MRDRVYPLVVLGAAARSQRANVTGRRNLLVAGVAFLGCVMALSLPASARPASARKLPLITVHARIRVFSNPVAPRNSLLAAREVTFSPGTINVGTVRIIITNSDSEPHWFEINGVSSKKLLEGGRDVMVVKFKRPGVYPVAVTTDTPSTFSGQLKVVA